MQNAQSQLDAANRRLSDASSQLDRTAGQLQTARDELQRIINKAKELLALSLGALAAHGAAKLGGANVSTTDLVGDGLGVIPFGKFGSTLLKGSTKVALNTTKVGEATVSSVDDVAKITRLNRLGSEVAEGTDFARHAAEGGGRAFKAAGGLGNRAKLAWESHVADTIGSSFKEKRISDLLTSNWSPLKDVDSFKSAIRADGSLDPLSMWSKGPQLVGSAPGVVTGVYDKVTGKD